MKQRIKHFLNIWKLDYTFKTFISSAVSSLFGFVFTILNGFLGIYYHSVWNGAICIYYVLLAIVRGIIVKSVRDQRKRNKKRVNPHRRKILFQIHIIMIIMNLSLIVPIAIMINGDRSCNIGLIPAITIATYTTYRIVMSVVHYEKSKKKNNLLVTVLRTVNLIDALVAILTLQNTMIIVNSGEIAGDMKILSIISSTAIWLCIVILTIKSFINLTVFKFRRNLS